jgi:hypothetical protein
MSLPGLNEEQSKTLRKLQLEYNLKHMKIIEEMHAREIYKTMEWCELPKPPED